MPRIPFPEGARAAVEASFAQHIQPHAKVVEFAVQATMRQMGLPLDMKASYDLVKTDGFDIPDSKPQEPKG